MDDPRDIPTSVSGGPDPPPGGTALEDHLPEGLVAARTLAEVVAHTGDGVMITDDELMWPGPAIVFVNDAMCRITGYAADELVGRTPRILQGRGTDRAVLDTLRSALSAGRSSRVELVNYRKDGTPYDAELFITPILDSAGRRTNFVSIHRDVSERKRTEATLRDREERLSAVLNATVDAIITIDGTGTMVAVNATTERMFGYTQEELIGQNVGLLMPSPHREEHDEYIARYRETGEARIIGIGREVTGRRKDGTTFPADLAVSAVEHLGLFTGIVRDISARKEAEERLRQADRLSSIGTLAAGLGHDMNNVLLPVRARLDAIEGAELPPPLREHFVEIRKAARYLQDLADGLHLLALDPEDSEASQESTKVDEWWEQVHTLLGRALPKHVRFSASFPSALPDVPVPPHRLTQAVLNMLVNSGKAVGEDGRVRLWAEVSDDGGVVRLGLTDNGCGMTAAVKRRAFEPFFTTKTRGLGTGLGLSLVQGVVHAGGGTVEIDSEPGEGTTIVMSFPAAAPPAADERSAEREPPRAVLSVRDGRVRSLAGSLLEMAGFAVTAGDAGQLADASLWVTDASNGGDATVRERLGPDCRVIILGRVAPERSEPRSVIIENPNDFDMLRAAISRAAEGIQP